MKKVVTLYMALCLLDYKVRELSFLSQNLSDELNYLKE